MPQPEPETLYPVFKRRCLLCGRPMNGWGFYTLYGPLEYEDRRVIGCGDPVHYRCAGHDEMREIVIDSSVWFGGTENARRYTRTVKIVSPGIILQQNGRYSARWNKKRLGTHATIDEAHAARAKHQQQLRTENPANTHSPASSHAWQTKRKKKEQRHERQIARR